MAQKKALKNLTVKKGDTVIVEYLGTLDNGEVFDDSSINKTPLEFVVGSGEVIKGFDDAVEGMELEVFKTIRLEPKDAYGEKLAELVQKVSIERLPSPDVKPGTLLAMQSPTGEKFPVMVLTVNDKEATLDMNHPLAGKPLNFKLKVVKIS